MKKRTKPLPMCPVVNSSRQCTINLSYPKQKAGSHIHLTENIRMASGSSNTEPCVPPSSDRLESAILHTSANFASIFEYFHSSSENEKTNQVSSRVSGGECLEAMYNQSVISQTKGRPPYLLNYSCTPGPEIIHIFACYFHIFHFEDL